MRPSSWLAILALLSLPTAARALDEDAAMGRKIQALLHKHQAEIFACVAKQKEEVSGEALLRVFVGGDGQAAKVELLKVEAGKPGARAAADCVASAARSWSLSSLGAGTGDQVVFPLAFRPQGPDLSAVGAHIQLVALRPHMTKSIATEHATAFYVLGPGAPTIECGDGKATTAVGDVVYVRGGCSAKLATQAGGSLLIIEATGDPVTHGSQFSKVEGGKLAALPISGGRADVRLFLDGTDAPFAVDRFCAKQGVEVPQHEHAGSDELVYVVSGRAETIIDGKSYVEKPGDVVSIPRGTQHAFKALDDLCSVQVYAPAGPEQRFKQRPNP